MLDRLRFAYLALFASAGACSAAGQYVAVNVHPPGYVHSELRGAYGGRQTGYAYRHDYRAMVWSGTSASAVSLHPSDSTESTASGIYAARQGGYRAAGFQAASHATIWSDTGGFQDIHPVDYLASGLYAMTDDAQVGTVVRRGPGQTERAGLWYGSGSSFVDLHPAAGYWRSTAYAVDGAFQYGTAAPTGHIERAVRWSGTAESMIELHPEGYDRSYIFDAQGGQQVGSAFHTQSFQTRAILWHGVPGSHVNLTPPGYTIASALGVANNVQAGYVGSLQTNDPRAAMWRGSAESFVDLHALLPAGYRSSIAWGIDPVTGDIVGSAYNTSMQRFEAIIWRRVDRSRR